MAKTYVIVGGVAGGASFAARLRRLDETCAIIMFERGEYVSFANCGLPYYVGGTITEKNYLILQTPKEIQDKFNITIHIQTEVTSILPESKKVVSKNVITGEIMETSYDQLILSPGASPFIPNIPGLESASNLFTLRTIPDSVKIKEYIKTHAVKSAAIIGGGFIGLEMAENLKELGLNITVIEKANQLMSPLDFEMAAIVAQHLKEHNVKLLLESEITEVHENGKLLTINGTDKLSTDIIILAIGVVSENQLLKAIGGELGVRNTIKVNERFETSIKDIYAIGDAIEVTDFTTKQPTFVPLAWPANRQGRLLADILNGSDVSYKGTCGSSIAKAFDLTIALTGANEKTLSRLGIPYTAIHTHPYNHAGYYPDAAMMSFKLIFNSETGQILGAQGVGMSGTDKRVDVIATAMQLGALAPKLADLELCYAPPYSSAKDPVNMLGYIAENIMDGKVKIASAKDVDTLLKENHVILDIREDIEYDLSHISGSIHIPLGTLRERLGELPKDKTLITTCMVGLRGYVAARMLMQHGFDVLNLDGGLKSYELLTLGDSADDVILDKGDAKVSEKQTISPNNLAKTIELDACGLQCPGPIMKVNDTLKLLQDGDIIKVSASDFGFKKDIEKWCNKTGNTFLEASLTNGRVSATIQKGSQSSDCCEALQDSLPASIKEGTTLVVFSGDFDKVMASFIIANGAAAMGKKVTMFFTFWGLNVLRKANSPKVNKGFIERMFGIMMPRGASKLQLSKMNMGGMGAAMMKGVMTSKNVDSLEALIEKALASGVHIVACTMSMDVMGIKQEELIDGIDFGGVASYLADTDDASLNLFV
ncbi:MAG: Multidomain redox protein (FAD)-dependent oxidoreductase [Clostridia bacterium]|jgi:NADPH-dependent 2,4-dienoyl-CoA reductase/sulfur reductase-like enzyme/peroxiredoxin family protein/TusA-related sulfurtransferase/rhodanese-related sulfurtransferase|nr:Multidomain redox protein (FAD)-dependent oxidoreductase [Clostridia bacterium]